MIESCFYYTNEDYKLERIQVGEPQNEVFIEGQSSTQYAREYTFHVKNNIKLRIIDTPGIFFINILLYTVMDRIDPEIDEGTQSDIYDF